MFVRLAIRSTIAGAVLLLGYAAVTHPGAAALVLCIAFMMSFAVVVTGLWP